MQSRIVDRRSVYSLVFARVIYAINFYNIAPLFAMVALDLHQSVYGLALITSTFYIGFGLFLVPSGILAARLAPRPIAVLGTAVASAASLSVAFATDLVQIALLRLIVGLGMAFFYAPSVTLISRTVQRGSEGVAVGLYNSAFYLGGLVGLFAWGVVGELIGWRASILFSGVLGLASAAILAVVLPREAKRVGFRVRLSSLKNVLFDRWLVILGIAMMALGVSFTLFTSFIPFYAQQELGLQSVLAGPLGGIPLLVALLGSPVAGRIYDSVFNVRRLLLYSGVFMVFGSVLLCLFSVGAAVFAGVIIGIGSAGFTIALCCVRDSGVEPEYEALAVGWANGLSQLGAFVPPLVFSTVVLGYGYPLGWLSGGIMTIVLLVPLLFAKMPVRKIRSSALTSATPKRSPAQPS